MHISGVSAQQTIFSSLFKDSSAHIDIIRIIANRRYGIGQAQLIREIKVSSVG